jgi:hypothetical protein
VPVNMDFLHLLAMRVIHCEKKSHIKIIRMQEKKE